MYVPNWLIVNDIAKPLSQWPKISFGFAQGLTDVCTGKLFSNPLSSCDWIETAPNPTREASVSIKHLFSKFEF